ncbi:MAG: hypothetical protein ACTSYR_03315 [Candidatus Odinarchaeia archaeon]
MPPLYWLLDVFIPDLEIFCGKIDFKGKLLIISEQLWSILKDNLVRSMLIGPGYLLGRGEIKGYPLEVSEPIISVILDPTELRPNQEIPLIDLMNPEVIDPTSEADIKEIEDTVSRVFLRHGRVLFDKRLAKIKIKGNIPKIIGIEKKTVKLNIKTFQGRDKIKFVLGGENNILYSKLLSLIKQNKFSTYKYMKILRSDLKKIHHIDSGEDLDNWIIIEKTTELEQEKIKPFTEEILGEFNKILNEVKLNFEKYIID